MANKKKYPTILSFERKINPSDGYLYGTKWDNREDLIPLHIVEKSVRGTISHRLTQTVEGDPMRLNNEVQKANPQTVDYCALPLGFDTLKMVFTVKILGNVGQPTSCNVTGFRNHLKNATSTYINSYGFKLLGRRYAQNFANARFLWRNRVGAEAIEVQVKEFGKDKIWKFNGKKYSTRNFENDDDQVNSLGDLIADTLSSNNAVTLEVETFAKLENAQEVFPSEELVLEKTGRKSKVLYSIDGIAAMHSQKLGNALRTIDTWYPEYSDPNNGVGPIAAEPYGAVTNMGKAFRSPKDKVDFYTLFDKFAYEEPLENENDKHFVMSVIIRGGVFGKGDKE